MRKTMGMVAVISAAMLAWTATDDPDHCYYRVFANGRQVASTVATTYTPTDAAATFAVVSVDRWGNVGSVGAD